MTVPLIERVKAAAVAVYDELGAGYTEKIYEEAMAVEFRKSEPPLEYDIEKVTEVQYRGEKVGTHILDFIVAGILVVELKAATSISKSNKAQLRSYMRAQGMSAGILVNFPYPENDDGPEFHVEQT